MTPKAALEARVKTRPVGEEMDLPNEGEMLRHLTLVPTRDHQTSGSPEVSTMS